MSKLIVGILLLALVLAIPAFNYAGTQMGKAYSREELNRVMDIWESKLVHSADRHDRRTATGRAYRFGRATYSRAVAGVSKRGAYGCFMYCVNASDRGELIYCYTYGESSKDRAWHKAIYGMKALGRCYANPTVIHAFEPSL